MSYSFLQSANDTSGQTTYTFSSQNFGTASSNRHLIVAIAARDAGTGGRTIDSVTIGGVTATIVVQRERAVTNTNIVGIAIAHVPTGTSGTVAITFSQAMARCGIALYSASDVLVSAGADTDSSIVDDPTVNLDIPAGGFAIGISTTAATATATWTNLTEDWDEQVSFSAMSAASDDFVGAQSGLALTSTWTSDTESVAAFASWAPAYAVNVFDAVSIVDFLGFYGDTVLISEYVVAQRVEPTADLTASVSDAVSITESTTQEVVHFASVVDAISIAEDTQQLKVMSVSASDDVSIAESVTPAQVFTASVSDDVSITESVAVQKVIEQSVSDSISIVDATDGLNQINFASVFDAVSIAEDVAAQRIDQGFETSVSDSVSIAEAVTLEATVNQTTFDAFTITESVASLVVTTASAADAVAITESVSLTLVLTNSVSDAVSISESTTTERTAAQSVSDAVSIAESVTNERTATASVSDALSIAEAVTLLHQESATASVSDTISILEDIVSSMTTFVSVFDAVSVAENVASEQFFVVPLAVDSVAISESVSVETIRFSPEKPLDRPRGYSDPDETFIGGSFVTTNMTVGGGI